METIKAISELCGKAITNLFSMFVYYALGFCVYYAVYGDSSMSFQDPWVYIIATIWPLVLIYKFVVYAFWFIVILFAFIGVCVLIYSVNESRKSRNTGEDQ